MRISRQEQTNVSVFDVIVGQDHAVAEFQRAASDASKVILGERGDAMTHAWLVTGPPGSGRSTLALAFAASLVCPQGGCGTCVDCKSALAGTHVDIEHIVPEGILYAIDDAKELVARAAVMPTRGAWHVIVVEDVDRFRIDSASTLLKSIEEPPAHTVWLLCAPTVDDVFATIRSRCRHVLLTTPSLPAIAEQLSARFGIDPAMATFAARAAQGHIGRARALATDENARIRRKEILEIPRMLTQVSSCFSLAAKIIENSAADADSILEPMNQIDEANIKMQFGDGAEGKAMRGNERSMKAAIKALETRHKRRRARVISDQYDRVLLDLTGFYRDVLVVQSGSSAPLINEEMRAQVEKLADADTQTETLMRIDAITETRDHLLANVAPLTAFEGLLVALRNPHIGG